MTPTPPHHRLSVHGLYAHLAFSLQADLTAPWTTLFGPSGSGKTTVLRAIAGLTPHLSVALDRYSPDRQSFHSLLPVPSQVRRLAYAPQKALLFPHLTVSENILFPQELQRSPNKSGPTLQELSDLLQLAPLLPKRPHQLSGGEQQRVALARALAVPGAQLLLLDEPFAGVDRALRDQLVTGLRSHLVARNLPALSVTHDADEALILEAEVLRLGNGQFTAQGPVRTVLADEIDRLRRLLYVK